jgi:AraC-like DNA-binding protein
VLLRLLTGPDVVTRVQPHPRRPHGDGAAVHGDDGDAHDQRAGQEGLAAEAGWSRKRLWSRFRSQIGLTPKRAAQLVRFDHAAHRLAAGHSAALVAAESGYTDHSHLHRDVRIFAGVTPTAVAAAPWLAVDPVAWAAPQHASRT